MGDDGIDGAVGRWWVRDSENRENAPGVLTRDRERGWWVLTTYGGLAEPVVGDGGLIEPIALLGESSGGTVTLPEAYPSSELTTGYRRDPMRDGLVAHTVQEFVAEFVIRDTHLAPAAKFATLEVPHPGAWYAFPPKLPLYTEGMDEYRESLQVEVTGATVTLARRALLHPWSRNYQSGGDNLGAWLVAPNRPFAADDALIGAAADVVESLHFALYGTEVPARDFSLKPANAPDEYVAWIAARPTEMNVPRSTPLVGVGQPSFRAVIAWWFGALSEPPQRFLPRPVPTGVSLEGRLRELVEQMEHLHRDAHPSFNWRALRRRDGIGELEVRLSHLVSTLGPRSCDWLLGGDGGQWAKVVARARNNLAHGGARTVAPERHLPTLLALVRSSEFVLRLASLRAAGWAHSEAVPGVVELLFDADGGLCRGHEESGPSPIMGEMREVHASRHVFAPWASKIAAAQRA